MGSQVSRTDFEWTYTDEPHASRRKEILKKYPEIKKLFGHDPRFKWIIMILVGIQIMMLPIINCLSWPYVIIMAYCIGGVLNHSLLMGIHEIVHNLAFGHGRPTANKLLGIVANLPIGIPLSVSYKKHHLIHHRYQGNDKLDTDAPLEIEARLFCTTLGKTIWLFFQPFFNFLRQTYMRTFPVTFLEVINVLLQVVFDVAVFYFFGFKGLFYLIGGSWLGMGLHPIAGHFISSHYMFVEGYETFSYYGPLNYFMFNIGYHNEHHDFPAVPASKLPKVKEIAAEYYDNLPHHNSWIQVLYEFITNPEIGHYSRIKRKKDVKIE